MKRLAISCLLVFMTFGGNAQTERVRTDSLMSSIYQGGYPGAAIAVIIFSNRTGVDLEDLVRVIDRIYGIDDKAFVKLEALIS